MWENTKRVLEDYGREAVTMIVDRLHSAGHVATGQLIDTLNFSVEEEDDSLVLYLHHQDYLKFIEGGIQPAGEYNSPGWKAYPAIRQWIQDKGLATQLPEVKSLSFLITRSLFVGYDGHPATGIEPDPIVEEVVRELNARYEDKINEALALDINEEVQIIMATSIW